MKNSWKTGVPAAAAGLLVAGSALAQTASRSRTRSGDDNGPGTYTYPTDASTSAARST